MILLKTLVRGLPGLALAALCGCSTPGHDWGDYDTLLYHGYQNAYRMDTLRQSLEGHIAWLETRHKKVPPGLYAELGTLCAQSGDTPRALVMYARERAAWPESRALMDTLMADLEPAPQASAQVPS